MQLLVFLANRGCIFLGLVALTVMLGVPSVEVQLQIATLVILVTTLLELVVLRVELIA